MKQLANINLSEYFHICLSAHWATAGTFVPTDVDNQIRQKLWKHKTIKKHIEKMAQLTIEAWSWDYSPMTNRKSYTESAEVISTHEGTWLSVAIGAYCALKSYKMSELASQVKETILKEIRKEEALLLGLRKNSEHINFIKATPLIAHNFGDLDRVMVAWDMHEKDEFCKSIYKLGHIVNPTYDPILVYAGKVNKKFTAKENHRHMALRKSKSLRKSSDFLVPVAPFMDDWGERIGKSEKLNLEEKSQIIAALYHGFQREDSAIGYSRACQRIIEANDGIESFAQFLPFDLMGQLKRGEFLKLSTDSKEDFYKDLSAQLDEFKCEATSISF